jgi:hypothetical protein
VVRPKHPDKDLESLIQRAEKQGWTVVRQKNYYRMRCPCGLHSKSVHKSPSDPRYTLNLRKWFERQSCWEEEQ